MKLTDREIRDAMTNRLSSLDVSPSRRAIIMNRINPEEDRWMRRKMTAGLICAIVLAIALTGVALALTTNLFEWFGRRDERYEKVAEQAALKSSAPVTVETERFGALSARFDSAYYDGMTLNVALVIEQYRRTAAYEPDPDALSQMETVPAMPDDVSPNETKEEAKSAADLRSAMQSAMDAGEPYGYQTTVFYASDHILTDDGVDIPPYAGDSYVDESGNYMEMREFESPLPEELKNREELYLTCDLYAYQEMWYFDGNALKHNTVREQVGVIRATVRKDDGVISELRGEYTLDGKTVTVTARVSAMNAAVTLKCDAECTLRELLGGAATPAGIDPSDIWVVIDACDEAGRVYRDERFFAPDQALPLEQGLIGVGETPEWLDVRVYLEWEGETLNNLSPVVIRLR